MRIKHIIQIGLMTLSFITFLQINVHAGRYVPPYMPGNPMHPMYPIIFEDNNDHEDEHLDFSKTKIDDSVKREMPEDQAHILSQKTIVKLNDYNTSNSKNPRIRIYTVNSVPNKDYENYLNQQIKLHRNTNAQDARGEIHYLIIVNDNLQYVKIYESTNSSYNLSADEIGHGTKTYLNKKEYDKVVEQIMTNIDNQKENGNNELGIGDKIIVLLIAILIIIIVIKMVIWILL